MRLELGNFQVKDVVFGSRTRYASGALEIDRDEVVRVVRQDSLIGHASVEIARPGESARIVHVRDVLEPKVKVAGPGVAYPGIGGRPIETVGQGRTHRLSNVTVMAVSRAGEIRAHGSREWGGHDPSNLFIDMSGPGAISPYATLFNVCVVMEPAGRQEQDHWNGIVQRALIRVCDLLAKATVGQEPPEV
ncbi:MAG: glycine/sarcosine/betaine reductase component B subunit, partial [Chloroflexota bacterium]|nr:glycine/sarcosine/betaine reductase component B subunit [Chloroflexota bacterium]